MIIKPRPDGLYVPLPPGQTIRSGVNADKVASLLEVRAERSALRLVQDLSEVSVMGQGVRKGVDG